MTAPTRCGPGIPSLRSGQALRALSCASPTPLIPPSACSFEREFLPQTDALS
jgi:hypothetical protein